MSRLVLTLAVDYARPGQAIGIKESIAMDLEKYGDVKVLRVDVREPEQLTMGGVVPEQRTVPADSLHRPASVQSDGQAQAAPSRSESCGARRSMPGNISRCLNCEFYRREPGMDEDGKFRWGICRRTGLAVRELRDQCGAWTQGG